MVSKLRIRRNDNTLVLDSQYVTLGLVKSGYMQDLGSWQRYRRTAINNPAMIPADGNFDPVHGFTVKAQAPLVFISGQGVFQNSSRSGEFETFYFAGASTSTRYYVYDLMSDRGAGTKLRLRDISGRVTFDSEQIPLNVIGSVTPPGPSAYNSTLLGYDSPYLGGTKFSYGGGNLATVGCTYSIYLGTGNYAASLPWGRGASHTAPESWTTSFGCSEGAYGNGNYITFIFYTDAGASFNSFYQGSFPGFSPPTFFLVPTDRVPSATFIEISQLPFPFDIT